MEWEWKNERKDKDVQCEVALVLETVGFGQENSHTNCDWFIGLNECVIVW